MDTKRIALAAAAAALSLLAAPLAVAEFMHSDTGFYIDPPEGYSLAADPAGGKFSFIDPTGQAELDIVSYDPARFPTADAMVQEIKRQLSADYAGKRFAFQGREVSFGKISFAAGSSRRSGYAFFAAGGKGERDLLALSIADASTAASLDDLLSSAIDSVSLDVAGTRLPGPASWAAHPLGASAAEAQPSSPTPAPPPAAAPARAPSSAIDWSALLASLPAQKEDDAASQEVVDREAKLLTRYGGSPLWKEAWIRFFRVVYRDSYHRLDRLSFAVGHEVERLWYEEGKVDGVLSDAKFASPSPEQPAPPEAYVSAALDFVNGFTYLRDPSVSDFENPVGAAFLRKGDCDARALLAAIVLNHLNQDACLMVSETYSHAMALVDLPGKPGANAGISVNGKRYLAAETTSRKAPGIIAQDMSLASEWIGVPLPF